MAFAVVLDTCVLYPMHLRDSLLRIAERGLYQAYWSDDILAELRRSLAESGLTQSSIDHILAQMQQAFPSAQVRGYRPLISAMTCDEKDRHVLAAAVRTNASAILTFNTSDFPAESVDLYKVDVIHPDAFLLDLLDLSSRDVMDELSKQAAANRKEPKTFYALMEALTLAGVPQFADEVRSRM